MHLRFDSVSQLRSFPQDWVRTLHVVNGCGFLPFAVFKQCLCHRWWMLRPALGAKFVRRNFDNDVQDTSSPGSSRSIESECPDCPRGGSWFGSRKCVGLRLSERGVACIEGYTCACHVACSLLWMCRATLEVGGTGLIAPLGRKWSKQFIA